LCSAAHQPSDGQAGGSETGGGVMDHEQFL
jgi:hypothetical protein